MLFRSLMKSAVSVLCIGIVSAAEDVAQSSGFFSTKTIITATAVVVALIAWLVLRSRERFSADQLPPTVGGLPFLGAGRKYFEDPEGLLVECTQKYGDCFSLLLVGHRMTILTGEAGSEFFFKGPGEDVFSAAEAYRFTVPIFGKDVVYDCEPAILAEQKKFTKHSFTPARFESYIPLFQAEVNAYFDANWGDEGCKDLLHAFNQVTVFTSVRALQGEEVRAALTSDFSQLYADLDAALTPLGFFFPNAPLPGTFRRDAARKKIDKLFLAILERRRQSPDELPDDIMSSFMQAFYKDGRPTDDYEVIGLLIGLLLAGQHTSNVTGSWTGYYLLSNPDYLKRVLDEQADILQGRAPTLKDLKSMKVLENGIKEVLRLRPPLCMLERKVMKDTEFGGKIIPAGSFVAMSPLLNQRLPAYWENPDNFDPDRFVRGEDKKFRFSYLPFGSGRHQCSGQKFAFHQIRTIWTTLLHKYEFELVSKEEAKPDYSTVIAGPKGPLMVRYKKRTTPLHQHYGSEHAQ